MATPRRLARVPRRRRQPLLAHESERLRGARVGRQDAARQPEVRLGGVELARLQRGEAVLREVLRVRRRLMMGK